jgi:hypothetical protein
MAFTGRRSNAESTSDVVQYSRISEKTCTVKSVKARKLIPSGISFVVGRVLFREWRQMSDEIVPFMKRKPYTKN